MNVCISHILSVRYGKIKYILPGGVADRQGGLKKGDQLICINEVNVEEQDQEMVADLLKTAKALKLMVRPRKNTMTTMKGESENSHFVFCFLVTLLLIFMNL